MAARSGPAAMPPRKTRCARSGRGPGGPAPGVLQLPSGLRGEQRHMRVTAGGAGAGDRPARAAAAAGAGDDRPLQGPVLHAQPPGPVRVPPVPDAAQQRGQLPRAHPGAPACIRRPPFLPGGSAALQGISLAHTQARRPVFADRISCLLAAQHCRASARRTPRRAGLFSPTALLACWLRSTAGHQRRARLRARHASCSLAAQQRRALATWLGATALGGARCMNKVFTLRQRFLRQPGGAQGKRHQQNLAKCAA
jgi:hypothetical protein